MQDTSQTYKVSLGIVGFGEQVRNHHLPYLLSKRSEDVSVCWVSGYLPPDPELMLEQPYRDRGIECQPGDWWKEDPKRIANIDGVVISLPNFLHAPEIEFALRNGKNVAVEKPTTLKSHDCRNLVGLAEAQDLVFLTVAQRRYEDLYVAAKEKVARSGRISVVNLLMSHERYPGTWHYCRSQSGGGALVSTGYHGIDTVLWLLNLTDSQKVAGSVSARWILEDPTDDKPEHDRIEDVLTARLCINDTVINCTISFRGPRGSMDENMKLYGDLGCVRIVRDRFARIDDSAATLSFQSSDGRAEEVYTRGMRGARWKPIEDFVNAVAARKRGYRWSVRSSARESLKTIEIIERSYYSAENSGVELPIFEGSDAARGIHHVAVQTSDLERALTFYARVMGATILQRASFKRRETAWLRSGSMIIELFSKRQGEQLQPWTDFYSGPVHLAFAVDDLAAFLSHAQSHGVTFHPSHPNVFVPPVPNAPQIAYLLGPDGEEVEVRPFK